MLLTIEYEQWGYLQRKPCHHSKSITTRDTNKNNASLLEAEKCLPKARDVNLLANCELRSKSFYQELYCMQRLLAKQQQRTTY